MIAGMFQVNLHHDKTTILFDLMQQAPLYVHTARFSQRNEKLQVFPVIPNKEEPDNGSSDQSGPRVVGDVETPPV
jgi:hypothetical protein